MPQAERSLKIEAALVTESLFGFEEWFPVDG
jgi:hypothetical protein